MPEHQLRNLRQKEREARRHLILKAARKLFAEKDFSSVTVREIAKEAGTSIGTIYNYYANLTELFLDVFLKHAEEIAAICHEENAKQPLSLDRLCALYIQYLHDNMTFYKMMSHFMLSGGLSVEGTQRLNQVMKTLMDQIVATIEPIRIYSDPRLVAHTLFSALNGIMISYSNYPGRSSAEIKEHTLRLAAMTAAVYKGEDMKRSCSEERNSKYSC